MENGLTMGAGVKAAEPAEPAGLVQGSKGTHACGLGNGGWTRSTGRRSDWWVQWQIGNREEVSKKEWVSNMALLSLS